METGRVKWWHLKATAIKQLKVGWNGGLFLFHLKESSERHSLLQGGDQVKLDTSPLCTASLLPLFSLIASPTLIFAEVVFYLVPSPLPWAGKKKIFLLSSLPSSFLWEKAILSRRRKKALSVLQMGGGRRREIEKGVRGVGVVRDQNWGWGAEERGGEKERRRWGMPNINSRLRITGAVLSASPRDAHVVSLHCSQ